MNQRNTTNSPERDYLNILNWPLKRSKGNVITWGKIYIVILILHLSACHVCAGMWQPEVGNRESLLSLSTSLFEKGSQWTWSPQISWTRRPAIWRSAFLCLPTPQLQANAVTPDLLHVSSGDVNLGPCTCALSTVPTESSSYTPYTDLKPFTKIIWNRPKGLMLRSKNCQDSSRCSCGRHWVCNFQKWFMRYKNGSIIIH